MSLLQAIPFLKGAVGRSLPGGAPSIYIFDEGVMYAQGPSVLAAYPVPHMLGTFAMGADDIERALGRMSSEPTVAAGDGTIILKSGRLRSTVDLLPCEPPEILNHEEGDPPPSALIDALRTALPFIPTEGTWNRSVMIDGSRIVALSNRASIEVVFDTLADCQQVTLSDDCAAYLCGLKDAPASWQHTNNAVIFSWADGIWARCQKTALPWPAPYDSPSFFDSFTDEAERKKRGWDALSNPVPITDEFRAAFEDVAALGDGTVTLTPDGMIGRSAHAEHAADLLTGALTKTIWDIKALKPVMAIAKEWHPDADGPAYFTGPSCRGVVVGQRR
jgi:hypothetical protein